LAESTANPDIKFLASIHTPCFDLVLKANIPESVLDFSPLGRRSAPGIPLQTKQKDMIRDLFLQEWACYRELEIGSPQCTSSESA
jgi:hypothetical protein